MLVRDSGVIQLFAENAQEAYDLMIMAPRIAEHPSVLLPVLVCQDGFTITHSAEPVEVLEDGSVELFVGAYEIPNPLLAVDAPTSQGPFAMPDYYFELRHQQVAAMAAALEVFDDVAAAFGRLSGSALPRCRGVRARGRRPSDRVARLHRWHDQGRRGRPAGRKASVSGCCRFDPSGRCPSTSSAPPCGSCRRWPCSTGRTPPEAGLRSLQR